MEGHRCMAGWVFSGRLGEDTKRAHGVVELIVHCIAPVSALIYLYGKLLYKINRRGGTNDITSVAMSKVRTVFKYLLLLKIFFTNNKNTQEVPFKKGEGCSILNASMNAIMLIFKTFCVRQ